MQACKQTVFPLFTKEHLKVVVVVVIIIIIIPLKVVML